MKASDVIGSRLAQEFISMKAIAYTVEARCDEYYSKDELEHHLSLSAQRHVFKSASKRCYF